ncbi:hypothetical protein MMC07_008785 [Pseudocyphellaria aurata]|nr:hypothetical protein [Pseudocyphellaria aurata]
MRISQHRSTFLQSFILLLPTLASASNDVCDARVGGKSYNFQSLGTPRSVVWTRETPPSEKKTTFTIDLCKPLKKLKGVPKGEDCPVGSYICAITRLYNPIENINGTIESAIGVAGEYQHSTSEALNPKWTSLKSSPSADDRQKDGLRLEMNGAKYPPDSSGKKQKAVIEFLCNAKEEERRRGVRPREDDDDGEDEEDPNAPDEVDDGKGGRLKFIEYVDVEGTMTLNLEWKTKYACEDVKPDPASSTGHWGFFTWLIIIVFLVTAAYLIFGSWLNYNRYSARGWDLVPHSESIRDIPYLLRDWMRRVVNTVQGGGSRGGYSAV